MKTCKKCGHEFEGRGCPECRKNRPARPCRKCGAVFAGAKCPTCYRESQKRWWAEHKEYHAQWRKDNRAAWYTIKSRRRGLWRDAIKVEFTDAEWQRVIDWYEGRCAYCGVELLIKGDRFDPRKLNQDHLIPMSMGFESAHAIYNLVPACRFCNISKNDRLRRLPVEHPWMYADPDEALRFLGSSVTKSVTTVGTNLDKLGQVGS